MSIADELHKLNQLREQGVLSHEEFEIAKRRLLENPNSPNNVDQLADIKAQNQIAQLDRAWEIEREEYGEIDNHGQTRSVIAGVVILGFGTVWTIIASIATADEPMAAKIFPVFGVVFIILGAGACIHSFRSTGRYQEAHSRYQQRRKQLTDKQSTS